MKKELNEYLYFEFGFDTDENREDHISESWPFTLKKVGNLELSGAKTTVFEFEHSGEIYYACHGGLLEFYSADGLSFNNFSRQMLGSSWIGNQGPVDLGTSYLGHPVIPSVKERKETFAELARAVNNESSFEILEGLFLETCKKHLAIVQFEKEECAQIIGDGIRVRNVPFQALSPWKRLSIAIGMLVEQGRLG